MILKFIYTSQILALRRLIEGVKDKNLEAILIFIDFKKAFDTVHRGKILILKALVIAISIIYEDTSAKVITSDGYGQIQNSCWCFTRGHTCPYLLVIVIDIMRIAIKGREEKLGFQLRKRHSRRVSPIIVTDIDFADDIALVSDGIKEEEEVLRRIELSAKCIGIIMNTVKKKYMSYNNKNSLISRLSMEQT